MEEQVKIEKNMRMVLDVEVSLMISNSFCFELDDLRAVFPQIVIPHTGRQWELLFGS